MPTTTAKRGPGRPATKKTTQPKKKVSIQRDIPKDQIREYQTQGKRGAVFLMQQSGITVFDKTSNSIREIRYCPNEPSIYRDEQSDAAKREAVIFQEGRLFVRPDQPNLMEFLDTHPGNTANKGNLFFLVDKEKKATVEVDKEFLVADAITMVRDKDLEELLSVCVAMGINIDRPVAEIKHDLLVFAKKNPAKFIDSFNNPSVAMKTKITMADKYQIIKLDRDGVKWFDTNKLIVSVPVGKNPTDVMVRYCLTEAAVPVVEEIDRQLER